MPSHEDIAHQRAQLATQRRRLAVLLQQIAGLGQLNTPPDVLGELVTVRQQIARIKDVLRAWGVDDETLTDDLDSQEATAGVAPVRMRVFISYKHDVTPDQPLAYALAAALHDAYDVFIDKDLPVGARWAEQIQAELGRTDALITLLSEQAVESAMIREEIAQAQALEQAHGKSILRGRQVPCLGSRVFALL